MFGEKKVEAKLIAKNVEKIESMPDMGFANPFLEAAAIQDESKSMWFHMTNYNVTFSVNNKNMDFKIGKQDFERMNEGDTGVLTYYGKEYISFEKNKLLK